MQMRLVLMLVASLTATSAFAQAQWLDPANSR